MKTQTTFKILFDNGKPYEVIVNNEVELKAELKKFYDSQKYEFLIYSPIVLNSNDEDISETQFISEIIEEIIE